MLSVKNLTKIYKIKGGNDTVALDKVNIDFPEKGMVFLLGKSGSGKSTLLNLIGGLDFPSDGEIILKGRSSKDFSQSDFDSYRNTYIGFIFQEYNILNEFNVEQNIALAIELQGKKVTKEAVDTLLEQVDLTGYGKRKPNTLSGGQKQRIAIARALIKEPNIIMADEPTGALDSKTGEQVFETLKKLSADKLVIVVSHDRDFAERFGDRIIELKDGHILSDQTKHMVESTPISDNVTIINDYAIKINDAKKLTKKDFDKLYESIKNSEGKVFISSGENADKSMKVARISEDGRSDEFKETGAIELKEYDASKTTFIRSKMPISKSTKMGLSSLKTKPVRLVFTMLLSVVSFTMFGVASSLMLYNSSHTYSRALRETDYTAEKLQKRATGKEISETVNSEGNVVDSWSYKTYQMAQFGVKEIEELNKNHLNLVYIPVCNVSNFLNINTSKMKNDASFYGQYYKITSLSDSNEEQFKKLGYHLDGAYPTKDDEVLLPKVFGEMLIESGVETKNNYLELIGEKVETSFMKKGINGKMTITGFFDAGEIPARYADLRNPDAKITPAEKQNLSENLVSFFSGSFNSVAFVTSTVFDSYNDSYSNGNYVNIASTPRSGLYLTQYETVAPDKLDDWTDGYYTEKTVEYYKDYFTFYNNNNEKVDNFTLKDDETYINKNAFREIAYQTQQSFYDNFLWINADTDIMRYMPSYYEFYRNNIDFIEELRNYPTYSRNELNLEETFGEYFAEFSKAYKISMFLGNYIGTQSYENLTDAQKELISEVMSSQPGVNTAAKVQQVYDILYEHADDTDGCANCLVKWYLDLARNNETLRFKMEEDPTISSAMYKDYRTWTTQEVNAVKSFLDENCKNGFSNYKNWETMLKGYTFKDFEPLSDAVLKPDQNLVCYYYSYTGEQGTLKIVGYYDCGDSGWCHIVTSKFLERYSKVPEYNGSGNTYRSHFETEYVAPEDARYSSVLVKTNYTQEQVEYMFKCNAKGAEYTFTSARYQSVNFIVEMINILKQVFFWVGVGFGVFAALMFLNFISVSIAGKQKDIGILRAIGARKSDVFKIFFSESLFIAGVCAVLALIFTFTAEFFLDSYFVSEISVSILQFSFVTVGLVAAIALVIAFVATIIPVLHSSRKPPVESIRAL